MRKVCSCEEAHFRILAAEELGAFGDFPDRYGVAECRVGELDRRVIHTDGFCIIGRQDEKHLQIPGRHTVLYFRRQHIEEVAVEDDNYLLLCGSDEAENYEYGKDNRSQMVHDSGFIWY